jgi:hypothetical protein
VILLQPDKANEHKTAALLKVPEVTLLFWIIKIAATEEDVPAHRSSDSDSAPDLA